MSPRLAFALDAVQKAGEITLQLFQTGHAVDLKEDQTPVTQADKGAERFLREAIAKAYPGDAILGEEEGGNADAETRWVIDPIDGTRSFVAGVPLYSVLLSYEVGGEPQLGVCHFPALGETAYAEVGKGAFNNGKPIQVSKPPHSHCTVCYGGLRRLIPNDRLTRILKATENMMAVRNWCDAYGHFLVATGRCHAMIDPVVSRWDISPLAVILREAGGRFTDFKGSDELSTEALSSNGELHPILLEALNP